MSMLEFEEYKGKLNTLKPALDDLQDALHLEEAKREIAELQEESAQDGFWNNVSHSQQVQQRIKQLQTKCEKYDKLCSSWDDLFTMCEMALEEDDASMLEELKAEFGPSICPVVVPIEQAGGRVFVNLIESKAYSYVNGTAREVPMPKYGHREDGLIEAMREAVAETDDALMEKFFEGEPFTQEELTEGVRVGVKTGAITPVLCGCSTALAGTDMVLRYIKKLLPSAARGAGCVAADRDGNEVEIACEAKDPLCAYVFKTVADPFVGKMSYVKVVSGTLKADSPVVNSRTGEPERMGKLVFVKGKKQTDAAEIGAGDIGAITKLPAAQTGDTLCAPGRVVSLPRPEFPRPTLSMAIKVKQKGDESKISGALQRLMEEDPTLGYAVNTETVQQLSLIHI